MNEIIKKNRTIEAIEYLNNHLDDDNMCIINNHWEDFLDDVQLKQVKAIEHFLEDVEHQFENYVSPSNIYMGIDEDGDIWVAGNESWAHKYFDADVPMGKSIDYLVEELINEKDNVLSRYDIDGYNYLDDYFTNLKSFEDEWKEYLEEYNVSAEECTLEEYARDGGYITIEEYLD